jgi:hypothetical protein
MCWPPAYIPWITSQRGTGVMMCGGICQASRKWHEGWLIIFFICIL